MDLYKEILVKVLEEHTAQVEFPTLKIDAEKIVETLEDIGSRDGCRHDFG